MVYGEGNNELKTARTYPKLVLIEISVHDGEYVVFDAPEQRPLFVKIPAENETQEVQVTWVTQFELISHKPCTWSHAHVSSSRVKFGPASRIKCNFSIFQLARRGESAGIRLRGRGGVLAVAFPVGQTLGVEVGVPRAVVPEGAREGVPQTEQDLPRGQQRFWGE